MGNYNKYTIGWICAITTEYVAAKVFLDKEHESLEYGSANDNNIYTLGEMGKHNVVIARLPKGDYGIAAAANVARDMVRTFPDIKIGLMVGIGGGAPSKKHDIRLGDVVVSAPNNGKGGLFQYDFGRTVQDQKFRAAGFLDQPPGLLRAAMGDIEAEYEMEGHQLNATINRALEKWPRLRKKYQRPDLSSDRLYQSHIVHPPDDGNSCEAVCGDDESKLIVRPDRSVEEDNPAIHYGLIASANQVMKDALVRDKLSAEKDVLCFEMEAAGLMNHFPCIVIRGICDYSDSHKNKEWQGYAAMTAAAYAKDLISRILPDRFEAEKRISDILSSVEKSIKEVQTTAQNTITAIEVLDIDRRREKVIAKLPYAKGSAFDSFDGVLDPRCHPETRTALRRQIRDWAENGQGKPIFWLKGMAGTGKSTISRTVAETFHMEGKLGASFFFKRGEADRGSMAMLFTTLCAQLLIKIPSLVTPVELAIDADPNISDKAMGEQFEKLICLPLSQVRGEHLQASKFIFVIDALDECAQDGDVFLRLLSQTRNTWSPSLQIFITSRPEQHMRYGFAQIPEDAHEDIVLHEIPLPIIKQDIATFLEYRFAQIQDKYIKVGQSLPFGWPGQEAMSALVEMAVPLFIFAATLCRFVEDPAWSDPPGQLKKVLGYQEIGRDSEMDQLDSTYSPILNQLIHGKLENTQKLLVKRFQDIVGTIIHLAEPLSRSSLASLLNVDSQQIEGQLSCLHSVLSVPTSAESPIRMLHLSFRDFLVDPDKRHANPFWIDEMETHKMIMAKCLERMSQPGGLQKNICKLSGYGAVRTEVDSRIITKYLPLDLQYACRFWVYHLKKSETHINDGDLVYAFLQNHFLHWLESLSFLGRTAETINLVQTLQTIASHKDTTIYRFLDDAMRFLRKNISVIDQAPLQLYTSALIFAPRRSIIKNQFMNKIPSLILKLPEVESAWSAALQTLEGHSDAVTAVAFSKDGKLVASASDDNTVKLWDPATGALRQTLKGHSSRVSAVAFSKDGKLVASGSQDHTVKLWDPATGTLQQTLQGNGHSFRRYVVAFSNDRKMVASCSSGKTVKLWDPATGTLQQTLEGHSAPVSAVAFSGDGKLVASGSDDKTIKLWDPATGALQQTLKGHCSRVSAVVFSKDGKLVASGSLDSTVKLWDPATGALQRTLQGHSNGANAVAFSKDGKLVASGSDDKTVKLWDIATGALQQTLQGHSNGVNSVAFSKDGKLVASGSDDKTVKLWDPASGALQQTLEGHSAPVNAVAFSRDGKLVASSSYDRTIKLWDSVTGTPQQTFYGHSGGVNAMAFSSDGTLVVSGSYKEIVKLWDPTTGTLEQTPEGHLSSVIAVAFSTNRELVASGSDDKNVKLWDPATGTLKQTLGGHSGPVNAVAFSSDGKLMASGSEDNTVKLWDPATGTLQQTLKGECNSVSAVAFSSDGKLVASTSGNMTVKLWNPATGALRRTLKGHNGLVSAVAFSSDGKRIASASYDWTVKLWDLATGTLQQTLEDHSAPVSAVAFSGDGKLVASGSNDNTVKLWDPATGTLKQTLEGHSAPVNAVTFSNDRKLVASSSKDCTVKLWDLAAGTLQQTLEGHSGSVMEVAFSVDGKLVASSTDRNTVKLWNPVTGALQQTLQGHSNGVNSVAFSKDGKLVASGSDDKTIKLWDPASGALQHTLEGHPAPIMAVTFSSDGRLVASSSKDCTVKLWDLATGTLQQTLEGHSGSVMEVAFSVDGKLVASSTDRNTVKLWNPATGALQRTFEGHSHRVSAVAFSGDGKLVASGSVDKTVKLWDAATGTLKQTLEGHSGPVYAVAFSSDRKLVASGSSDGTVKIWDPATNVLQRTVEDHFYWVSAVRFSNNGQLVASASYDKTVKLWDPATGALQRTLQGHSNGVNAVAFSKDGKLVASGSADKTVKLWDLATGTLQQTLQGHSNGVNSVAFSKDGKLVATASFDKTVKLWDPAAGALRQTLEGHSAPVMAVAFSSDGKLVASGSVDKTVKLWDSATGTLQRTFGGEGHDPPVTAVAFASDGKLVAYSSFDRTIKLWDPATSTLQRTLEAHSSALTLPISRDGNFLETVHGRFDIRCLGLRSPSPTANNFYSNIVLKNRWVALNDSNFIWLPSENRAICFDVYGSMLVMGHDSGRVTFLTLV